MRTTKTDYEANTDTFNHVFDLEKYGLKGKDNGQLCNIITITYTK